MQTRPTVQAVRSHVGKEVKPCADERLRIKTVHVSCIRERKLKVTTPVENDGTWNIYKEIVLESEELEEDVRRLHGLIAAAERHYEVMYERYCNVPGWELLHAQMSKALGWPEILLEVLPDEE